MEPEVVSAIAQSVAALGVVFVAYQVVLLKGQIALAQRSANDDHSRSRREFTVRLIQFWTEAGSPYRAAAARLVGMLSADACGQIVNLQPAKLPKACRPLIETCLADILPEAPLIEEGEHIIVPARAVVQLRYYAVRYLNQLEAILLAADLGCAERAEINAEFRDIAGDFDYALETFRSKLDTSETTAFPAIHRFVAQIKSERLVGAPPPRGVLGSVKSGAQLTSVAAAERDELR